MKNSAWYHKLWRDKFDGLPVKDAADASWAGMQKLLNEQMPIGTGGSQASHLSRGTKLLKVVKVLKIIGYTFSAAAAISTAGYFTLIKSSNKQNEIEKKVKPVFSDSILVDSNKLLNYDKIVDSTITEDSLVDEGDSLNADGDQNKTVCNDHLDLATTARQMAISALPTVKADAVFPFRNKYPVAKKIKRLQSPIDLNKVSLNSSSKVEVISSNDQKKDSLIRKSGKLLTWPEGYQQGLTSYIDLTLKTRPIAVGVSDANDFKNSSGNQDNRTRHYDKKAERITNGKNQKERNISFPKIRTNKAKQNSSIDPKYSYGLTSGMNVQKGNNSFYLGVSGSYAFDKNWQLAVGLNSNSSQNIRGEFSHSIYYRPDSLPPLIIATTRKLITIDIPLAAAYKLSKHIDLKAGPIISFVARQSTVSTKLNPIINPRDTLYHSKQIDSILINTNTVNNKVNIGLTGGVSVHIKQFNINGSYQWLTPYRLNNNLGSFKHRNHFFRIGIEYRFR